MADELEDFWRDIRPGYRGGRGRSVWLIGKVFGRLTVIERAGTDKHGASTWKCVCECGAEKVVKRGALIQGRVKSCGCLLKEYRHSQKAHLVEHAKGRKIDDELIDELEAMFEDDEEADIPF